MFTGLIRSVGSVGRVQRGSSALRLVIDAPDLLGMVRPGDSVAVNGACLTAAAVDPRLVFDVVTETILRTVLAELTPGRRVNLEPALAVGDRLGGHFVNGHVDGVGTVRALQREQGQTLLTVAAGPDIMRDVLLKGSIAVDGVSLTVAELVGDSFGVALVPFTLEHTTLGEVAVGGRVNLETDLIGKWVRRVLETRSADTLLTESFLREHGFV